MLAKPLAVALDSASPTSRQILDTSFLVLQQVLNGVHLASPRAPSASVVASQERWPAHPNY